MKQHKNKSKTHKKTGAPEEIENEYIKDLQDWTDNRYNPGFYTEGHILPELKYPKRPIGILLIFFGFLTLILGYGIRLEGLTLFALVAFIAGMLQLVAGLIVAFKTPKT